VDMGEWRDPGAPRAAAPRLLSLQFRRHGPAPA
jgi:hypothetical protein